MRIGVKAFLKDPLELQTASASCWGMEKDPNPGLWTSKSEWHLLVKHSGVVRGYAGPPSLMLDACVLLRQRFPWPRSEALPGR